MPGQTDRAADGPRLGDHVVAQHPGLAGVGPEDRRQDPDGGRLAGAVGPEEAEDGAGRHEEVDAVERGNIPEPFDEARGNDGSGVHTSSIGQILGRAK